ncbi:MAG TPA: C40 family peptidase [Trebonia sp.]|jgi:cell wall-associated NlpC family hydrolase
MLLAGLLLVPMMIAGGITLIEGSNGGTGCSSSGQPEQDQPAPSAAGKSIPANYLTWYKKVGQQYNVPWTILAGIGTEESDNGQSTLPGVHTGANAFGAAGPMQLGIEGASGDAWDTYETDEDGQGAPSVYDPADAIAAAAKYLVAHGVQADPDGAIFAYNHADWYVQDVLNFASQYASGGFTVDTAQQSGGSSTCTGNMTLDAAESPNAEASTAISYAQEQIGKPYLWGGTGPDAFDCSGLVMMAYRQAGITTARTSEEQWATEKKVSASQVQPGDLVFFAGSDGTPTAPGHVGLVIGKNQMIEAYATGFPVRVSSFGESSSPAGDNTVVGFTNPWASSQTGSVAAGSAPAQSSGTSTTDNGNQGGTAIAGTPGQTVVGSSPKGTGGTNG